MQPLPAGSALVSNIAGHEPRLGCLCLPQEIQCRNLSHGAKAM